MTDKSISTLSCEDVLRIHEALCVEFAETEDPISPSGVKSQALLESAVGRQNAGVLRARFHPDPVTNAASLGFGLCNNHPFHNGNKRTALVSMLAHLDRNRLVLVNTKQKDLFEMILAVANSEASTRLVRTRAQHGLRGRSDAEVQALATWLKQRVQKVSRGERQITYRQLRAILQMHGYELELKTGNRADVIRVIEKKGLFRRDTTIERKRIGTIGYHSDGMPVAMREIKRIRALTKLTEEDGCDSDGFYATAETYDVFINQHRTILRRLAHA